MTCTNHDELIYARNNFKIKEHCIHRRRRLFLYERVSFDIRDSQSVCVQRCSCVFVYTTCRGLCTHVADIYRIDFRWSVCVVALCGMRRCCTIFCAYFEYTYVHICVDSVTIKGISCASYGEQKQRNLIAESVIEYEIEFEFLIGLYVCFVQICVFSKNLRVFMKSPPVVFSSLHACAVRRTRSSIT